MNSFRLRLLLLLLLPVLLSPPSIFLNRASSAVPQAQSTAANREESYRANNIGVALLEQFKPKEAAESFRRALQLNPKLTIARINLGIALYNIPDVPGAQREEQSVSTAAQTFPQPHYILGLIAKAQNRPEDAIASFQRVLKIDPDDVGTKINLGQLYSQQRKYAEAISVLREAITDEPYNGTALYNLGTALVRVGQRDEGQRVMNQFQGLRERGSGTAMGSNYLEQGRYAEAITSTGAEAELVDQAVPAVTFKDATADLLPPSGTKPEPGASTNVFGRQLQRGELNDASRREFAASLGGNVTLFDFDLDGDLDLFWISPNSQQLYRNDKGRFTNITRESGALNAKVSDVGIGAVSGDYDNDGKPDLFVIRSGGLQLYHNDGGKFSDVTAAAGIPAYPYLPGAVAFVDVDHDGDLDIFVSGLADLSKVPNTDSPTFPLDFAAASNLLLRNDGKGKFTDVTATAKLDVTGHSTGLVPTDFNNKRDVDLLVLNYGTAPSLFSNLRDGSFRDVASETRLGTEGRWTATAAGDINKDGYTDFLFGRSDGPALLAVSDGHEKFKTSPGPPGSDGVRAAQFLDYDNDGLLDCAALTDRGLRVWRNCFMDVTNRAVSPDLSIKLKQNTNRLLASGDIDNDGDEDLILLSSSGQLTIARNEGGNTNHSLPIRLASRVSNRSAVGAKLELRAGSLAQKLETYSASPAPAPADTIFGLGSRTTADAVRVLWPAGIVQAETEVASRTASAPALSITELDRKPSSCPYLYTWNGERFEFVTDFMGGGEMGHMEKPGVYNSPDPDEYVRIRDDQLKERNGRYELRVTNELEEALFVDHLQLIAVAHRQEVEVYPNEGLIDPPRPPFKLYTTRGATVPLAATDDHGHDVLTRISKLDREYPDDFRLHPIRGYADEHTLTLKLKAEGQAKERIVLLLTGWTDYAWSSDILAASQSGSSLMLPALQVKDTRGQWRTVIENIGIPVGRPQTIPVDLTGKFLSADREVRIVTNMRIYWDQILVDISGGNEPVQLTRLNPIVAALRWRGYSKEFSPDGRQPLGYDYDEVSFTSPWKVMTGRYTREGDVRELLSKSDDMFAISRPGDEITLSFAADQLPALPRGWKRTFLLYADGFSKEMDINSASPDQVGPLPFHGMTKYPYEFPERYPLTEERRHYLETYNTRVVTSNVPSLLTEVLGGR
jgi:Flp pilus assembly protein TadD